MASGPHMTAPICLVENNNMQLSVSQTAIQILERISQPVVVVAIVGLYRTGKSYLMNRLAGQNRGFPLGSTVQSKTKGIWIWCVPHPCKPNHTLVLLDTEGLGDVEKGDPKNDSWIFALAVLLCSTFVYNSMGTINHQALEQLHYVTELTELIRAKSSPEKDGTQDSTEFVSFFPDFIWAVRDFTLELKLNDHPITEDEYLENALKIQASNLPRECIRHFFPKRKCFVFDRPVNETKLLANIENIPEHQLDPKFLTHANNFCSYILTQARTKTLREGVTITGNRLKTLVVTYVNTINTGAVPCLENAVTTLSQLENSEAVQKAANHYSEQMSQRLALPTDTLQELLDVHADCEREALGVFMKHSFKDDKQEFQKTLVVMSNFLLSDAHSKSFSTYIAPCCITVSLTMKSLNAPVLRESISAGTFSVPGGYKLYREAKESIEWKYSQVPRKGVKVRNRGAWGAYIMESKGSPNNLRAQPLLWVTTAWRYHDSLASEERLSKEAAEREQEMLKQKLLEQQQQMEAQQRSLQENLVHLEEKMKKERENLIKEQNMILEHKLKVSLPMALVMLGGPSSGTSGKDG
uniref:GB1/RHD3-type G domain-containing protein n=1 Tax=Neovison vison TaxID=452646 RepID=A0A8C7C2S6_NEOVI